MSTDSGDGEGPTPPRGSGAHLRVLGMDVRVPWSGVLGVALIAWLWTPTFGAGTAGMMASVVFALLLYVSILAHELGHGLLARWFGNPVQGITLWVFGGFTVFERRQLSPWRDGLISAVGPAVTLAIAGVLQLALIAFRSALPAEVALVMDALVWTNMLLGVLNLLPGLPLDGGGVVRAIAWGLTGSEYRGTVVAAWFGRIIGAIVVAVPLLLAILGRDVGLMSVVAAAVFGIFVFSGATVALRRAQLDARIPNLQAGTLARRAVPAARNDSLALAQQRMHDAQAGAIVVVDDIGRPTGVVSEAAAAATPPERRAWVPVSSLVTPLPAAANIPSPLGGRDLIAALQAANVPAVLVRDSAGAIYGVLFVDDVERALA